MVLEAKEKCKIKPHSNTHHEFLHKQPGNVPQMTISFLSANGKEAARIKKNGRAKTILSLCPQCQIEPRLCADHKERFCSRRQGLASRNSLFIFHPYGRSRIQGGDDSCPGNGPPNGMQHEIGGRQQERPYIQLYRKREVLCFLKFFYQEDS